MLLTSAGNLGIGINTPTYKLHVNGGVLLEDGWLRIKGEKGLFFEDFGGGFFMKDNTWVRIFNNKSFYHSTGIMRTDGAFQVGPNGDRFIVNDDGKVGIGTTTPEAELHIGTLGLTDSDVALRVGGNGDFAVDASGVVGGRFMVKHNGKVGIGIENPASKLHVENGNILLNNGALVVQDTWNATGTVQLGGPTAVPGITFKSNDPDNYRYDIKATSDGIRFATHNGTGIPPIRLSILNDGKILIGDAPTPGDYKLYVEKGILTERVRAALKSSTRWADDAFGKKPTIQEMEQFIQENSHLIGVPSADELVESGVDMVEMDATLLRQIEWLWEYTIETHKEKKALEKTVVELSQRLEKIEQLLEK